MQLQIRRSDENDRTGNGIPIVYSNGNSNQGLIEFVQGERFIAASHGGEEIYWTIGSLDKGYVNPEFDIFEQINKFWEQLDAKKQLAIFEVYKKIRLAFDESEDRNQLTMSLYYSVSTLMNLHDLEDLEHWMLFHSGVYFPDASILKTEYIASPDVPGTREQTYLRDDYVKLITLSLALRAMVPVWGEFIGRTRNEAGTQFKEFYAFKLLNKSKMINCPAMEKLRVYVEFSSIAGSNKASSIIGGISSQDFPLWILSQVVTRKLCVADIRGINQQSMLVMFLWNYIRTKVTGVDSSFNGPSGIIKDKMFEEAAGGDGDRNVSRLEGYKIRQDIPSGDIVALEYSARDPYEIAMKLAPTMDLQLLESALKTTEVLSSQRVYEPQVIILQWVMKPVIPVRGINFLGKTTIVRLMAVAQAVLWHRGHKELSCISTATISEDANEMQISGVDSRARIPKESVAEIERLYPHVRRPTGKQKTVKYVNQALAAIDSMTSMLTEVCWTLTIDDKFLLELSGNTNRRYAIPHDIKIKLANLVIQTGNRSF